MEILIGLSPILLIIVLAIIISGIVVWISRKSNPNYDSERRIRELEEENKNLRKNNNV